MPAMKLSPAIRPMTTRKPVLLSERCGVSSAENSGGSALRGLEGVALAHLSIIPASWRARRPRHRKRNRGSPGSRSRGRRPKSRKPFAVSRRQAPRRPRNCNQSIPTRCWSRSCSPRRRPMPASTRRRPRCSPRPTRRRKWPRSARSACASSSRRSGSIATRRRTSSSSRAGLSPSMAARCRAIARRWKRCPASGARPPTSCSTSRSANRRLRSTRTSFASATAPTWRRGSPRSRSSLLSTRSCPTSTSCTRTTG